MAEAVAEAVAEVGVVASDEQVWGTVSDTVDRRLHFSEPQWAVDSGQHLQGSKHSGHRPADPPKPSNQDHRPSGLAGLVLESGQTPRQKLSQARGNDASSGGAAAFSDRQ